MDAGTSNPPRNGEGDRAKRGGGADHGGLGFSVSFHGLPTPRSGEELESCITVLQPSSWAKGGA
jgi:hypothetical protein